MTSLPTGGDVHIHRNMTTTDECSICSFAADKWHHTLPQCNMVKVVWTLLEEDLVEFVFASKKVDPKLPTITFFILYNFFLNSMNIVHSFFVNYVIFFNIA